MSVWFCIPSKRSPAEAEAALSRWRNLGYRLAIWRDTGDEPVDCDILMRGSYPGYARAVNALCAAVIERDPEAGWLVTGGDDILPDPDHSPDQIAAECSQHFGGTFGVMQPTGHRWGQGQGGFPPDSAYIDRIAGSPWMGREWCIRANRGEGPFYPAFEHMFGDECLQRVAMKLQVFWQRRDLTHFHNHWGLTGDRRKMPGFLARWNTPEHWSKSKALFERLKAQGFEECLPI